MTAWHNILDWGVEGKAWTDCERDFDRLPGRARASVPEPVWNLSRSATGMAVLFESDAPAIHARWELESEVFNEPNFPATGFSGLDLYARTKRGWRWVAAGYLVTSSRHEQVLMDGMPAEKRRYLLYLPLRNPVTRVEIGVPDGASFLPVPPRKARPIVYYGTSIVHGAYASRPGMVHPSILGRWLDRPVINLGFSGNARMEPALAELLGEIRAKVFIIDCVPNMSAEQIRERAVPFITLLRRRQPRTPIVLVEGRPYTNSWIRPALLAEEKAQRKACRRAFRQLQDAGLSDGLFYLAGKSLFGDDNEASLDGSHPSDLGFMRMAEALYPILRKIC
jgi:lysophospholipase L1-like esterase